MKSGKNRLLDLAEKWMDGYLDNRRRQLALQEQTLQWEKEQYEFFKPLLGRFGSIPFNQFIGKKTMLFPPQGPGGAPSVEFLSMATTQNSALTRYIALGSGVLAPTEASVRMPVPRNATIRNFYVNPASNTINTGNVTVTLRKNAAATAITFTIAAGNTNWQRDITNSVSVVAGLTPAGDDLTLEVVTGGSAGAFGALFAWTLD